MTGGACDRGRHGGVRKKGGEGDNGKWEVYCQIEGEPLVKDQRNCNGRIRKVWPDETN